METNASFNAELAPIQLICFISVVVDTPLYWASWKTSLINNLKIKSH